jgi:hypothetical protein
VTVGLCLDALPKAQFTEERMDKSEFVTIDFCPVKNMVKITKRERTLWEKNLCKYSW